MRWVGRARWRTPSSCTLPMALCKLQACSWLMAFRFRVVGSDARSVPMLAGRPRRRRRHAVAIRHSEVLPVAIRHGVRWTAMRVGPCGSIWIGFCLTPRERVRATALPAWRTAFAVGAPRSPPNRTSNRHHGRHYDIGPSSVCGGYRAPEARRPTVTESFLPSQLWVSFQKNVNWITEPSEQPSTGRSATHIWRAATGMASAW